MIPTQQKPETPWYHKWWAAPAIGAGVLGSGYLADKLLNGGQLSSSLMNSAKPAGITTPQAAPVPAAQTQPFSKAPVSPPPSDLDNKMWENVRNNMDTNIEYDNTPTNAAIGATGLPSMGGHLLAEAGSHIPKIGPYLKPVANAFGHVNTVLAPAFDYIQGSSPAISGGIKDTYARMGMPMSDANAKAVGGGMGALAGSLSMALAPATFGVAPIATNLAMQGTNHYLNDWQKQINDADTSSANGYALSEKLIDNIRKGDISGIKAMADKYPEFKNNPFAKNMGGPLKEQVTQAWGPADSDLPPQHDVSWSPSFGNTFAGSFRPRTIPPAN